MNCHILSKNNHKQFEESLDNKGFSLIEVIVAVAILAAVATPILRSFTNAAQTNARAQISQNVTSLAENVMEKVKSTDIKTLHAEATSTGTTIGNTTLSADKITFLSSGNVDEKTDFADSKTPPFSIKYENITATSGKTYDAIVDISTEKYAKAIGADASDANTFEVPEIKSVDSAKHAVLSWEINSIDESAIDRIVDENSLELSSKSTVKNTSKVNGTKTTTIFIEDEHYEDPDNSSNQKDMIKVSCKVSYDPKATGMKPVEHLVYTGYFDKPANIEEGPNLYLFYSTMRSAGVGGSYDYFKNEKIVVKDKTSDQKHDIYLILQGGVTKLQDNTNPSEVINIGMDIYETSAEVHTGVPTNMTTNILPLNGSTKNAKLYTNILYGATEVDKSDLFDKSVKNRIYYVTVKITKPGATDLSDGSQDVYTVYTSTMNTGDEAKN